MLESSHQFDPASPAADAFNALPGQSYSVRPLPVRNPHDGRRTDTEFTPGQRSTEAHLSNAGSEPEFPIGQEKGAPHYRSADGEDERCRLEDSNPWPSDYKSDALPTELSRPDSCDTPLTSEVSEGPALLASGETESISGLFRHDTQRELAGGGTEFSEGHRDGDDLSIHALAEPIPDVGHAATETQRSNADIGETLALIVENWRARQDFLRARMRLELQAQAVCRRYCDGDKAEAAKLWAKVKKDRDHELLVWLEPYILAMVPLDTAKHKVELKLAKLARDLPVYDWAKSVSGFGDVSLAAVVGECAIGPGEYRTVSALWKRMGMAVFDGQRQRKVSGDAAIEQGYNPTRRSLMWNIGCCLIKAQIRSEKDEKGKKVEGSEYAIGEYGQLYLDRKQYLRERSEVAEQPMPPFMLHKNAQRYIEKRLLRELWKAWRRGGPVIGRNPSMPCPPSSPSSASVEAAQPEAVLN